MLDEQIDSVITDSIMPVSDSVGVSGLFVKRNGLLETFLTV